MSEPSSNRHVNIYLSFPIACNNESDKIAVATFINMVEMYLKNCAGVSILNPLDNGNSPEGKRTREFCKKVVDNDLEMMKKADVLLGYYVHPSVGQSMEVVLMHEMGKPRVVIIDDEKDIDTVSPWLVHYTVLTRMRNLTAVLDWMSSEVVWKEIIQK